MVLNTTNKVIFIFLKEKLNEEIIKEIKQKIDRKKLITYLKNYPEKIRKKISDLLRS